MSNVSCWHVRLPSTQETMPEAVAVPIEQLTNVQVFWNAVVHLHVLPVPFVICARAAPFVRG